MIHDSITDVNDDHKASEPPYVEKLEKTHINAVARAMADDIAALDSKATDYVDKLYAIVQAGHDGLEVKSIIYHDNDKDTVKALKDSTKDADKLAHKYGTSPEKGQPMQAWLVSIGAAIATFFLGKAALKGDREADGDRPEQKGTSFLGRVAAVLGIALVVAAGIKFGVQNETFGQVKADTTNFFTKRYQAEKNAVAPQGPSK